MTTESFDHGWTVGPKISIYAALQGAGGGGEDITLPHDALFAAERSAEHGEGAHSGFYPGGAFTYAKTFPVPESYRGKRVTIEFQGAYRDAVVFVNGAFAAQRPNGYATFFVPLDPFLRYGEDNTISVEVRAHEDARWYTGAGLHRDVRLHLTNLAHLAVEGPRITTPDVDDERAVVEIATDVANESAGTTTLTVHTSIASPSGDVAAEDTALVTVRAGAVATVRQRLYVERPTRWDINNPALYRARSVLEDVLDVVDETETTFGIRTLQLDPRNGLRINGAAVKLRGACIHSDNGLLGAAAVPAAEERRIRILKEAGFNAVRSAHNPMSEAMLDACDRLGMLVMDELSDVWTVSKSTNDYSLAFPEWWERDIVSMVTKDRNHPSVVFYSIGNENPENGDRLGTGWARALAEKVRQLDDTRYVTNGVNGFVAAIDESAKMMQDQTASAAADGGINGAMNVGDFMNQVSASPAVTARTSEAFSVLDVAGMNYGDARYALDKELFPNRVIVGTETFPSHIDVNWRLVEEHSHVIGDFTWTGWDYLGEAGAGRITYLDDGATPSFAAPFPWLTAWTGDVDITGHRRPVSYYREIVFGLRHEPYIAVQRPDTVGRPAFAGQWSWSDTVAGWSWAAHNGARTVVEVYSDADEVELTLNGRTVGRAPAGRDNAFRATFEVDVEPGELVATDYVRGSARAHTTLRSATGPVMCAARPERNVADSDGSDLVFIPVTLEDQDGNLLHDDDRAVQVSLSGPGVLAAVGSARPDNAERYDGASHTTFDGRALVIVRPVGAGVVTVTVSADGAQPTTVRFTAGTAASSAGTAPLAAVDSGEVRV
ncbi:glycoside hydrolase family 2 [Curtobacterium sp. MCPF17_018]|uniref:glycoside hydrolase family 2 TIM barrel-domain containing protein n=1 Tax=Curtobacterium sp. MCPF17_018 TaxID=2175638 RepID=UPI000DA9B0A4|nr:glycoside hydrolase family 2 TIM barrel-domain containing protein [Curtobacterium sp. MCPF17_018]PZE67380.1 glycoside hydrolase family 2 [Curtobacterium sp. MCPF17_018]